MVRRKVVRKGGLQSWERRFDTKAKAKEYARTRIKSKLAKGYERNPRRRA